MSQKQLEDYFSCIGFLSGYMNSHNTLLHSYKSGYMTEKEYTKESNELSIRYTQELKLYKQLHKMVSNLPNGLYNVMMDEYNWRSRVRTAMFHSIFSMCVPY